MKEAFCNQKKCKCWKSFPLTKSVLNGLCLKYFYKNSQLRTLMHKGCVAIVLLCLQNVLRTKMICN